MKFLLRFLFIPALLPLASCNESSSEPLITSRVVMTGSLEVDGSNVRMRVNLGKENSSVVVVLQGGDTLSAGNGSSTVGMDYTADVFGSHYRAAFPLNMAATYSNTLTRGADSSSAFSVFPPLPNAFSVVAPVSGSIYSLATTTDLDVAWDVTVNSDELALDAEYSCDWDVNPLPPSHTFGPVHRSSGEYRVVNIVERNDRRAAVDMFTFVDLQRAELAADNPDSTVDLLACTATFELRAKRVASAHVSLSPHSRLTSRRTALTSVQLRP